MSDAERNNAQYKRNIAALPDFCYAVIGGELVRINVGEPGVYPITDRGGKPITGKAAVDKAASVNKAMGVTPAQVKAMAAGMAQGWESPDAHPEKYA